MASTRPETATEQSKLRAWRLEHGYLLQEVADLTGLSESMVSRVERGERTLSPMGRVHFARRVGARVADLFEVADAELDVEAVAS